MAPRTTKKKERRFTPANDNESLEMVWVPISIAVQKTHFSRSTLLRLAGDKRNGIRSFLYKSHPDAQSGRRLLHLPDLVAFFARQAEEAQAIGASLEEQ